MKAMTNICDLLFTLKRKSIYAEEGRAKKFDFFRNLKRRCLHLWVLLLYFKHTLLTYNLHLGRLFESRRYTKQILQTEKSLTGT